MIGFAVPPIDLVRIGIVGLGNRGVAALNRYAYIDGAKVTSVCDLQEERVNIPLSSQVKKYSGAQAWKELCSDENVDLVYICTDWLSHAEIACYAMECGKHVAVEVPMATTVEQCMRLVRVAEATKRHCTMLENCIYDVFEATTFNMVKAGIFGDVYHAEGGYIHDLQYLMPWRSDFNNNHMGDNYPTHGFAPLCRLMDIHRSDSLKDITSFSTPTPEGNHIISVIRTARGKSIILQHNISVARPYSRLYQFTAEKGFASKYPSPVMSLRPDASRWLEPSKMSMLMDEYLPEYHKVVCEMMPDGLDERRYMDYAMDYRLIYCLRNGLPLDIDVYDAAAWSCISELSHISIENGSIPISFPDFLA